MRVPTKQEAQPNNEGRGFLVTAPAQRCLHPSACCIPQLSRNLLMPLQTAASRISLHVHPQVGKAQT